MIVFGTSYCSMLPYDILTLLINNREDLIILNIPKIHSKIQNQMYLHLYPFKTSLMTKKNYCLFDFFWLLGKFRK